MTVDIGADQTLVRPGLVEDEWLPDSPQQLCGVTGNCMSLQGPVNACVRAGGVEEDMPVFVADLDEECLLGYDYLTRMDACVDFRQERMTVRGHDVPFLREVRRAEVVTTKRLRLASRTEARVQCRLTRVMKEAEGLVDPVSDLRQADGVALGKSLVGAGEELNTVFLANFSDKARNIPAGTPVGACEEVQRTEARRQAVRPRVAGPLPGFLEDLAQRSATYLKEAQTERLAEAHREVRGKQRTASHAMKELYDHPMRDARYAEGDRVWLHNTRRRRGLSPKLQSLWVGPYTVVAVPSAVTYKISRGHKQALVVHADRLWRYHGPGSFSWGSDEPEEEGSAEDVPEAMEDVPKEVEEAVGDDAGDSQLVVETAARPVRHRRPPVYLRDFELS
ncbi:hypothetical protein E2C01_070693 [Portunus trituberculatus]|uniref:Integrase p58-like C-terminal domain-containing protein n=1 Tax=Portunus trituberculatus TaxID=210409 RepID=A0A5B7I654_PORTR|nr:hypothetical protein [Portunus trituberculatus]